MNLYPYQQEVVDWFIKNGSGLNACAVGLGKTVQTFAIIDRLNLRRVLIVCPAILKLQWAQEAAKFIPSYKTQVIAGNYAARVKQWQAPADIYIANYEQLINDTDWPFFYRHEWDLIVADEATKISNIKAKQSRAIKRLRAKRRIALTGTPLSNRVHDIYNIIDFARPGVLGKYIHFIDHYCIKNYWGGIFGYKDLDELKKRLTPYMIRRRAEDVLPQLPEKIISEIPFELSLVERELYDKIKKELLFEIEKEDISKIENPITLQATIVKMIRLSQLTDSMELLGDNKISTKIEVLKELLLKLIPESKVIVYTRFEKFSRILARELSEYKPLLITGAASNREEVISKFNTDNDHKVCIVTDAGAYGLNLQYQCSSVVFMDTPFSVGKSTQIIGRVHRIGQTRPVLVYYLIADKTIDRHIRNILAKKQDLEDMVLSWQDVKSILSE